MNPQERRAELIVTASFLLCAATAIGLAVLYWQGGQPQVEGTLLGVAFGALAVGFVTWGNRLLPQGPESQDREELVAGPELQRAFEEDLERGGLVGPAGMPRRTMLLRALGLAAGGLGVAALFPIRSLGPKPGNTLSHTEWRNGLRLVTEDGRPVRVDQVPLNGLVTVFPEGFPGSAAGQAVLIRVEPGLISPRPGRATWSPDGFIAYSKVCSHAGCPVGLFTPQTNQLLCPCHQSTFDVLNGARPLFGPAAVSLPQLPLSINLNGELLATGDFSAPIGPAFWHHT